MAKRCFEDLVDGEKLDCEKVVFSREDIVEFGEKFDPQSFHINENAAERSIFGGLVAYSCCLYPGCCRSSG